MKRILLTAVSAIVVCSISMGQDPRERNYNYEILHPSHEAKPKVEGFATERLDEMIGRGTVAGFTQDGKGVHVSWRLLKTDNENVGFDVFRIENGRQRKLNRKPIIATTDFVDTALPSSKVTYKVVTAGISQQDQVRNNEMVFDPTIRHDLNYISIKLHDPNVKAGKIAVADLNGDGVYDYIIRHPHTNVDPGTAPDTIGTTYKIEAYLSDGTYLWTKDLGPGIEPGIWYSPFVAYDFDGDGKAEVAIKTSGDNWAKNERHRINAGDEYLTILNGMTGEEIVSVDWPERNFRLGNVVRQNRNQMGIAYLDGKTPCLLAARGTYRMMMVDAYQFHGGKLEKLWRWDGDEENPVVRSQGAHNMVCGDVDGDGRDEILLGGCMLDDDGTLLWSAGLGHPDKAYLTTIDPSREGMQVFLAIEPWQDNGYGVAMLDARTGERIWGIGQKTFHVGDGMVADIDPSRPGLECFASEDKKGGSTDKYLLSAQGEMIANGSDVPPCRNWIWWDNRKVRQTFFGDDNRWGASSESGGRKQDIGYWNGDVIAKGIEGDIIMIADLFGDWREEVVTALPGEIRIYYTNIPATDRRVTLMQDPIYRSYVIQRSQGYPQSPVPSYYLGE